MTKYTNPFHTIEATLNILKSLGADPTATPNNAASPSSLSASTSGATYAFPWGHLMPKAGESTTEPESEIYWQEHVTSVTVQKIYEGSTHYYTCSMHMTCKGFDALLKVLGNNYPIAIESISSDYNMEYIEPSSELRIFKLELRGESK